MLHSNYHDLTNNHTIPYSTLSIGDNRGGLEKEILSRKYSLFRPVQPFPPKFYCTKPA